MATSESYIEFVCEQISGVENVRYKKMFGEYMVFVNEKPIILVCDNTVYVKKIDELQDILQGAKVAVPYKGAKERYVLDIEDTELANEVILMLEKVTPMPKPKAKRARMEKKAKVEQ